MITNCIAILFETAFTNMTVSSRKLLIRDGPRITILVMMIANILHVLATTGIGTQSIV